MYVCVRVCTCVCVCVRVLYVACVPVCWCELTDSACRTLVHGMHASIPIMTIHELLIGEHLHIGDLLVSVQTRRVLV